MKRVSMVATLPSLPGVSRKTYATLAVANRAHQSQFAVVVAHCLASLARFSTIAMIAENRVESTILSTNRLAFRWHNAC
jgi:hypothetical protein